MIRIEKAHLKTAASTHPGMTGKNNEDKYAISAFMLERKDIVPVLLAVLSDGIGGHRAGEVASEMVVDVVSDVVAQSDGKAPLKTLQTAIHQASNQIFQESKNESARKGMGATVSCALIINNRLYTATVGDSRIYLIRDQHIRQISIDHTWIQEALESGLISPEQAIGHPNAHVIRRYVGSPTPPEVDFRMKLGAQESNEHSINNQGFMLKEGDKLLLCSDGLTDLVSDQEILTVLTGNDLEDALQIMENMANERGGHDNITMTAIEVPQGSLIEEKETISKKRFWILGCSTLLLAAILALALVFGFGLLNLGSLWPGKESTPTPSMTEEFESMTTLTATSENHGRDVKPRKTKIIEEAEKTLPPPPTNTVEHEEEALPAITRTPFPTDTYTPDELSTAESQAGGSGGD